jgi:[ribosomal protein S18]-alanine N-acetyltransferase
VTVELSIERMSVEDVPEVLEIEHSTFRFPWTKGMFLHELKIPFSRSCVVRLGDGSRKLAGYVCWWVVGDEAEILNIAVDPSCRRLGIARALLAHVESDARARGATAVHLEVERDNTAARRLYESLGFCESGLRRNYYASGVDALTMSRRLGAEPK